MRETIFNKKIPTLLGLFVIGIGIVVTSFLARNSTNTFTNASPTWEPQNIKVTNINDNSFTVSYTTETETNGSISFGKDINLGNSAIDDFDKINNNISSKKIHYFTIDNLEADTKYFFTIMSGNNVYSNNNIPFEISTSKKLEANVSNLDKVGGKVIQTNGESPKEAIVYLTGENIQPLSTLVKKDGTYELNISFLKNQNLDNIVSLKENDILSINIVGNSMQSQIKILAKQVNSVPVVILSQNYDFTIDSSTEKPNASESSRFASFPISTSKITTYATPRITNPKENQVFTDQQPTFRGTASAGTYINIKIEPTNITDQVRTSSTGNWSYRPKLPLDTGKHTIIISSKDEFGMTKTSNQSFSILALGSQVIQSATPSASPVVTFTPTPTTMVISITPTITPYPTFTPIPTPTFVPTSIPTPIPTAIVITPTIPPVSQISPTKIIAKGPKDPGSSSVIIMSTIATIASAIGIFLYLISRKSPRF